MDFKGITWVGNVYQKFETICLEVEEIMYQDTVKYFEDHVKYVEDQVETVGESVKKFCSEIMNDLMLPDDLEVADSDFPLQQNTNVKLCKKPKFGIEGDPKVGIKEESVKLDIDRLTKHSEIAGLNDCVEDKSSFNGLHSVIKLFPSYSGTSVKQACADLHLVKNNDGIMDMNGDLDISENHEKMNQFPTEVLGVITPMAGDLSRVSSFAEPLNENHEDGGNQMAITSLPSSVEITKCEGGICDEIADEIAISVDLPLHPSVESIDKEGTEMVFSSKGGSSTESNAANTPMNEGAVPMIGSSLDRDIQHNESAKKDLLSHSERSDGWNMDAVEISDDIEPGIETTKELLDNVKLDDTCIMVDGDDLQFVSHKEGKVWLAKKKLRNAFYSKRRLARKEYERLAVWHRAIDSGSNQPTAENLMPSDKRTSTDHDSNQSEWELL